MKNGYWKRFLRHGGSIEQRSPSSFRARKCRFPDAGGDGGGDGDAGGDDDGDGDDDKDDKPQFSQKQVNAMLKKERQSNEKTNAGTLKQLRELEKAKGLSDEQRTELASKIHEMEQSNMTASEKAIADRKALEDRSATEIAAANTRADTNWGLFEDSTKRTAIVNAASKHGAFSTEQIEAVVLPRVKLVPIYGGEENKEIQGYRTVVPGVEVKDEATGQVKEEDVSVEAFVEMMKGNPAHENLFLAKGKGGSGFRPGSGASGGAGDTSKMSSREKINQGLRDLGHDA